MTVEGEILGYLLAQGHDVEGLEVKAKRDYVRDRAGRFAHVIGHVDWADPTSREEARTRVADTMRGMSQDDLSEIGAEHGLPPLNPQVTGPTQYRGRIASRAVEAQFATEHAGQPADTPDDAALSRAFEGTFGGLTSEVMQSRNLLGNAGDPAVEVVGQVLDEDGYEAGSWQRTFFPDEHRVSHDSLFLNSDQRGEGFASGFNRQAEQEYAALGYNKITLTAGLADGPRVWAKAGYGWRDGKFPEPLADDLRDGSGRPEVDALLARLDAGDTPTPADVIDTDFGRYAMTQRGWKGEKPVRVLAGVKRLAAGTQVLMLLDVLPADPGGEGVKRVSLREYVRDDRGRFADVPDTRAPAPDPVYDLPSRSNALVPRVLADAETKIREDWEDDRKSFAIQRALREGEPIPVRQPIWTTNGNDRGVKPYPAGMAGQVQALDATIARNKIRAEATVWRGLTIGADQTLEPGTVITDKGYTSVSTERKWAYAMAAMRSRPIPDAALQDGVTDRGTAGETAKVLEMILPAGFHVGYGDYSVSEYLLPRNGKYRVLGTRRNGDVVVQAL